ncbi:mitochondrial carrier domain-containing protein [Trichoderma ceciliae]
MSSFMVEFLRGGVSAAVSKTAAAPIERAKLLIKRRKKQQRHFESFIDVYRKTLAPDGIVGLSCGFLPSVFGAVVYRVLRFSVYDSFKPLVIIGALEKNILASSCLGYVATTGAGVAAYPSDAIRRRMTMTSGEAVKHNSSFDTA